MKQVLRLYHAARTSSHKSKSISSWNLRSNTSWSWKPTLVAALQQKKHHLAAGVGLYLFQNACLSKNPECSPASVTNADEEVAPSISLLLKAASEATSLLLRALYLLVIFAPVLILAAFVDRFQGRLRTLWLDLLLTTLQNAGPVFIKWGQWAATRPDIFPADVCQQLSKLHNKAPEHSYIETRKIVEGAFCCKLEDVFEDFTVHPLASGSIAQVHQATLKPVRGNVERQRVAVKVRHPFVLQNIERDFRIIKTLAWVSNLVPALKHLQLDKSADQFAHFMAQQVDFTLEAVHLSTFIHNFHKANDIIFPQPKYPFVHPAVLVESFEDGLCISSYITAGSDEYKLKSQLAELSTKTFLKMLLEDNFIHGDLHPGNVLVRLNGSSPQLVLVDAGMIAELNMKSRLTVLELFKGVAERDGAKVAECTLRFSENQTCPEPELFKRDVDDKFRNLLSNDSSAQSIGECMMQLFDEIRKHRVNVDGDVCTVMVTTLVLEGWQRKLDPDFDMLNILGSMLDKLHHKSGIEHVLRAAGAP